jgi:hypothetical protein
MRTAALPAALALLLSTLLLTGCQWWPREPAISLPPAGEMPTLSEEGATLYRVDPERSVISLKVYREGSLARLGHNHIVVIPRITGTVFRQDALTRSGARLLLPMRDVHIDRPTDRRAAGDDFSDRISARAIEATRRNMLGSDFLDTERFPLIEMRVAGIRGRPPQVTLVTRVKVKGRVSELAIPAHLELGARRIKVWGSVSLSQRQLGLEPFSVMAGNLRVRDAIDVDFYIIANRD